jgi:hypothetical protein
VGEVGSKVELLSGLVVAGTLNIEGQPSYLWLNGPRECVLLKATGEAKRAGLASFCSLVVGEFCVEVYHLSPAGDACLLHQDDFCFK